VVTRVAIKKTQLCATSRGVHDLIDIWKAGDMFMAVLVEIVVDAHSHFTSFLFYKDFIFLTYRGAYIYVLNRHLRAYLFLP
jgi:hypothetical protein